MYTTERFMRDIWQGPPEEEAACRNALQSLGDGPEADKVRDLLARVVQTFRRQQGPAWPAWPLITDMDGQLVTVQDIARMVDWPEDRVDTDISRLVEAGLLRTK